MYCFIISTFFQVINLLLNFAWLVEVDLILFVKAENDGLVDASPTAPAGTCYVQ
jgi:hypothetical protein